MKPTSVNPVKRVEITPAYDVVLAEIFKVMVVDIRILLNKIMTKDTVNL